MSTKKIHYDGNVGIGNSNPDEKLVVEGNIKAGSKKTICTNRGMLGFSDNPNDKNHAIYNNHLNLDDEGAWDGMKFNVFAGASFRVGDKKSEAMLINAKSQVMIGGDKLNENFKMQVKGGDGSWKGGIASGGENANVVIGELFKNASIGGHSSTLNSWTNLLINPYGGNVGVGTGEHVLTEKFEVSGNIKCTEVLQTSDGRLKKEVVPIQNALDRIINLQGCTYHWKDETMGEDLEIGLIAQEVEAIFPEVVTSDKEGNKSIAYSKMVAPLIEAIKEQQDQIECLKEDLLRLKS